MELTVICNKHNKPCKLKERIRNFDAFLYICPEGCEIPVTGPQLERAERNDL